MLFTDSGISIEVRLIHSKNACSPILVTDVGILIEDIERQLSKAFLPMLLTDSGMSIDFRLWHSQNNAISILVREFDNFTEVRPLQN